MEIINAILSFSPLSPSLYCLSSIGAANRLGHLGNLVASSDDALASRVIDIGNVLVLELSALPDLNLTSTTENTVAHGRQKIVSGVGVIVDTTVEDGGSILANSGLDQGSATRVILDEVSDIVDDTSDGNKSLSVLGLLNKVVPANDRKLLEWGSPVEGGSLLVELLLELLNTSLLNLVGTELLEVVGETEPLPEGDGPLGGIPLPPLDSIAVIRGELVVEVVVSLTEGDEGGDDVVTG